MQALQDAKIASYWHMPLDTTQSTVTIVNFNSFDHKVTGHFHDVKDHRARSVLG